MLNASVRAVIKDAADKQSIPPWNLMAVADVESDGVVFWVINNQNAPAARPEGHYFYARLKGDDLKKAVSLGLAHPRSGGVKVPRQRAAVYAMIDQMIAVNEQAALESCSWGVGQVMGANWQSLGYPNVKALYDENQSGLAGQLNCMMKFIVKNGLLDELREGRFADFAKRYNGPGYKANNYDVKMVTAAAQYKRMDEGPKEEKAVINEEVRRIQTNMNTLGYYTAEINGIEDQRLRDSIMKYQTANGLVVDGMYGKMTSAAVDEHLAKKTAKSANNNIGVGITGVAATNMGEQIMSQSSTFMGLGDVPYLKVIVTIITVIGTGLILYGIYRKFRTPELDPQ